MNYLCLCFSPKEIIRAEFKKLELNKIKKGQN